MRIEFRGRNVAEAIEDEESAIRRIEVLARNKEEDEKMVADIPWDFKAFIPDSVVEAENSPVEPIVDECCTKYPKVLTKEEAFDRKKTTHRLNENSKNNTELQEEKNIELPPLEIDISQFTPSASQDEEKGVIAQKSDRQLSFSFDDELSLENHDGPPPSLLLQALTMSNSNDGNSRIDSYIT